MRTEDQRQVRVVAGPRDTEQAEIELAVERAGSSNPTMIQTRPTTKRSPDMNEDR